MTRTPPQEVVTPREVVRGFCPTKVVISEVCLGSVSDRSCQGTTFRGGGAARNNISVQKYLFYNLFIAHNPNSIPLHFFNFLIFNFLIASSLILFTFFPTVPWVLFTDGAQLAFRDPRGFGIVRLRSDPLRQLRRALGEGPSNQFPQIKKTLQSCVIEYVIH